MLQGLGYASMEKIAYNDSRHRPERPSERLHHPTAVVAPPIISDFVIYPA
jgi:hypothetical protein